MESRGCSSLLHWEEAVGSSLMKVVPPAGLKNLDPIWATEPYWLWCWETVPPGRGPLWFGESVLWLPVCWIQH